MYKLAKPFFIIVQTSLHAGSGSDLSIVDLPIQREKHTNFPKIESSSLKGSIREVFEGLKTKDGKVASEGLKKAFSSLENELTKGENKSTEETKENEKNKKLIKFDEAISLAFGPKEGDAHAGALGFTDARILLFPVKSMKGIFAYITCRKVLERFKNDLEICKKTGAITSHFFDEKNVPQENTISDLGGVVINGTVVLEEYSFTLNKEKTTEEFAEWLGDLTGIEDIKNKLVVLPDDDFRDFVVLSTEVITRTRIDSETGTVATGALFTEEYLPPETVLYSLALTTPIFNKEKGIFKGTEEKKVMLFFEKGIPEVMQIGGNATIGKGIVRIRVWEDKNGK